MATLRKSKKLLRARIPKANFETMLVEITSSWCHPVNGRIIPNGNKIDIDERFFNASHMKKATKESKKRVKLKNKEK